MTFPGMEQQLSKEHEGALAFHGVFVREAVFSDMGVDQPIVAPGMVDANLGLRVGHKFSDDGRMCSVLLSVKIEPPEGVPAFKELRATVEGIFGVGPDKDPKDLQKFVELQAPALLVPYLRETISRLTSTARVSTLVLPPLNMVKVMGDMKKSVGAGAAPAALKA
jgi:preprotein translocase subunit SecB